MDMQQIMKQAQAMQKRMEEIQVDFASRKIEGQAGGGLVKILVSGRGDMLKVDISEELLKPSEKEVLQDLLVAAYNDARGKMESDFNASMAKLTSEMGLPADFKLPHS